MISKVAQILAVIEANAAIANIPPVQIAAIVAAAKKTLGV